MALFSERYGYTKPSDVIIREQITPEIQNAILSCYDKLHIDVSHESEKIYLSAEKYLWTYFLNQRESLFDYIHSPVSTKYIEDKDKKWYEKLNLVEFTIKYYYAVAEQIISSIGKVADSFVSNLNGEFERLNFAYRIVNKEIVEITAKEEIVAIEDALKNSKCNIRTHLNKALELYAQKPTGDYSNSIKESISAVEAFCREKTEQDTLGKALNKLESNGILIPKLLKQAFEKLYAYTNQPETGIRHALMDNEGKYIPAQEEALFMLVSCSAFINYLNKKMK
jgi:hypothetical protein